MSAERDSNLVSRYGHEWLHDDRDPSRHAPYCGRFVGASDALLVCSCPYEMNGRDADPIRGAVSPVLRQYTTRQPAPASRFEAVQRRAPEKDAPSQVETRSRAPVEKMPCARRKLAKTSFFLPAGACAPAPLLRSRRRPTCFTKHARGRGTEGSHTGLTSNSTGATSPKIGQN